MSFIIRVYCEDRIYSVDLSEMQTMTIGCDSADTVQLVNCGLKKKQITIDSKRDGFVIKGKKLYDSKNSPVSSEKIAEDDTYVIDTRPKVHIAVHPKRDGRSRMIELGRDNDILIGRGRGNNIILHNGRTSSKHCRIYYESGLIKIRDLDSLNGTFVNGKKIYDKILVDGDRINISIYELIVKQNTLIINNVGEDIELNLGISYEEKPVIEEVKKQPDGGTISVFGEDMQNDEPRQYGANLTEKMKSGTMSVFDIDIHENNDEQSTTSTSQTMKKGTMSVFDLD